MVPPAHRLIAALALCGALVAGCSSGPGATGIDEPLPSAVAATVVPEPSASSEPATQQPGSSAAPMAQTDTDWGRIWDDLPASFPEIPGATLSEEAGSDGPVSATFNVPGRDPAGIAQLLQTELEIATYSTEALSGPLEDGSFVLDSVGEGDCRIETTIRPMGDTSVVTIRYGAACPGA